MAQHNTDPLLLGKTGEEATHFPYMQAVVTFNLAVYLLHTYLDVRQLKVTRSFDRRRRDSRPEKTERHYIGRLRTCNCGRPSVAAGYKASESTCSAQGPYGSKGVQENAELSGR